MIWYQSVYAVSAFSLPMYVQCLKLSWETEAWNSNLVFLVGAKGSVTWNINSCLHGTCLQALEQEQSWVSNFSDPMQDVGIPLTCLMPHWHFVSIRLLFVNNTLKMKKVAFFPKYVSLLLSIRLIHQIRLDHSSQL